MEQIDPTVIRDAYRGTGSAPFDPVPLLAVARFCILGGSTSPAKWWRQAKDSKACEVLGRGYRPSRTAWYNFRDRCGKFIQQVHQQLVIQARQKGLIAGEEGILDGTFFAASASRHRMVNLQQVNRDLATLKYAIKQQDDPAQVAPKSPAVKSSKRVAPTARGRQWQFARLREAKRRLLQEIERNNRRPKAYQRDVEKMCIAPADVDAVKGKDKRGVIRPLYNVQNTIDVSSDLILSYGVFQQNNDTGLLAPMLDHTQAVVGGTLVAAHADSGYCSILEITDAKERNVELFAPVQKYVSGTGKSRNGADQLPASAFDFDAKTKTLTCPGGHTMRRVSRSRCPRADGRYVIELRYEQEVDTCRSCPLANECLGAGSLRRTVRRLENQYLLDQQQAKMKSEQGRASFRLRKNVERRFGDRILHRGGEQLSGRGLWRAKTEAGLLAVAQNVLTLLGLRKRAENPGC